MSTLKYTVVQQKLRIILYTTVQQYKNTTTPTGKKSTEKYCLELVRSSPIRKRQDLVEVDKFQELNCEKFEEVRKLMGSDLFQMFLGKRKHRTNPMKEMKNVPYNSRKSWALFTI